MKNTDPETVIYKYMSLESFLHFFLNGELIFQKVRMWPDSFEGVRFNLLTKTGIWGNNNENIIDDYFGSCWSLQIEDRRLFKNESEYVESCKEIRELGSASMWEDYCKNGGVRVCTTVGKVLETINKKENKIWHGNVYYEPSWYMKTKPIEAEETLFHKRTCFRHENEYRFLIKNKHSDPIITFKIDNMREFIDGILVSPSVETKSWVSRAIYKLLVNSDIAYTEFSTNDKNGKQYFHISQLYGLITEEVN
jgi:hypothetical protein